MAQNYEIDIKRFNGQDYDTLLPTPASHASTHQAGGSDPITMQTGNYANGSVTLPKIDSSAIDDAPTQNSSKLVTSGGVATAIANAGTPYNYAQNADFTQWVAQGGIGYSHGNQAYGGDRWILDSGTITGTARADGNGYENITLNGTIRQIVANPPATGTVGVDMISGTATASYANGEITITSSGGVPKDVWLYEGTYEAGAAPKYQSKGYGAELAECQRCFLFDVGYNQSGYAISSGCACLISTPVKMRVKPTAVLTRQNAAVWAGGSGQVTGVNVSDLRENGVSVSLILSTYPSSLTPIVTAEPKIDLCADYE